MSVTDQLEDHQARCLAHLLSLRMLAQTEPGALLPRRVVAEIARTTGAVVAEAEAASQAVLTAGLSGYHRGDGSFLRVRLDRLWRPRPRMQSPRRARETLPTCAGACAGSTR